MDLKALTEAVQSCSFPCMAEFPPGLYIVSLHKLIKILIFHFIHKYWGAKCPQRYT